MLKTRRQPRGHWTPDRIIEAAWDFTTRYNRPPAVTDWCPALARSSGVPDRADRFYADNAYPHLHSVRCRFGGWRNMLAAAGIEGPPPGRKYTDTGELVPVGHTKTEHGWAHPKRINLKTHCKHGHPFSAENTYHAPNGQRQCRECLRRASREYRRRKRSTGA